jgi:hypothetical protein
VVLEHLQILAAAVEAAVFLVPLMESAARAVQEL